MCQYAPMLNQNLREEFFHKEAGLILLSALHIFPATSIRPSLGKIICK